MSVERGAARLSVERGGARFTHPCRRLPLGPGRGGGRASHRLVDHRREPLVVTCETAKPPRSRRRADPPQCQSGATTNQAGSDAANGGWATVAPRKVPLEPYHRPAAQDRRVLLRQELATPLKGFAGLLMRCVHAKRTMSAFGRLLSATRCLGFTQCILHSPTSFEPHAASRGCTRTRQTHTCSTIKRENEKWVNTPSQARGELLHHPASWTMTAHKTT